MRINSSGQVGIGTTNPNKQLVLSGNGGTSIDEVTFRIIDKDGDVPDGQVISNIETFSSDLDGPHIASFIRTVSRETFGRLNAMSFGVTQTINADATEVLRVDDNGLLKFNSGYGSVETAYGCRAWVNFNGTGTVAIREDGNVTSITDNGTGDYTVNFTTAMPDTNYCVAASGEVVLVTRTTILAPVSVGYTTSSIRLEAINNATDVLTDTANCNVSIFR